MNISEITLAPNSSSQRNVTLPPCIVFLLPNFPVYHCGEQRGITGPGFIMWGIVLPCIGTFGLICNCLTFLVLMCNKTNSTFLVFVRALVISDLSVVIFVTLLSTGSTYLRYVFVSGSTYFTDEATAHALLFLFHLASTSFTLNIWIVLTITVDRFISLCFPLRANMIRSARYAWQMLGGALVITLVFRFPYYVAQTVAACDIPKCYIYRFTAIGKTQWFGAYSQWGSAVVNYFVPLSVLFVLNICIMAKMSQFAHKRRVMAPAATDRAAFDRKEREWNLAMVLVITVFLICQTPVCIEDFFTFEKTVGNQYFGYSVNLCIVFNSSINIFIYIIAGKGFRQDLRRLLTC